MGKRPKKTVPLSQKALDLLSRRRLTRGELKFKLLTRDYKEAEIDVLLNRYEEIGYLDDESLANDYARDRLNIKPMGRMLLKIELKKRRIPESIVEKAVEKIFSENKEEELAELYLQSLLAKTRNRKKIWDRLARRGFQYGIIETVMSRFSPEEGYEWNNQ
jgi:regulatory protein